MTKDQPTNFNLSQFNPVIFLRSGLFLQIVLKTRESVMERTIQYVGIGASIISIIKVSDGIITKYLQ